MATLVKPFHFGKRYDLSPMIKTNILIVVDKGAAIAKALKLVEVFDIDPFRNRFGTAFIAFDPCTGGGNGEAALKYTVTVTIAEMKQGLKTDPHRTSQHLTRYQQHLRA